MLRFLHLVIETAHCYKSFLAELSAKAGIVIGAFPSDRLFTSQILVTSRYALTAVPCPR